MIPKNKDEIVVARVTFSDTINPQFAHITNTRKRSELSGTSSAIAREWLDRVIAQTRATLPIGTVLRFAEYKILSGDRELFRIHGTNFHEKILLVLTERFTYWFFYRLNPGNAALDNVVGRAFLPISFCPCCFRSQYVSTINAVKRAIGPRQPVQV